MTAQQIAIFAGRVRLTFGRIGRTHVHPPLDIDSTDPQVIADEVLAYARRFLVSPDVEAAVDMDRMTVTILCGYQVGGTATIEHVSPEVWL